MRNLFENQPISKDITLIGIDDYTNGKLGLFGRGQWVTRRPFVDQLEYVREFYKPAVLAYDIIFSETQGDDEKIESKVSKENLLEILIALRKHHSEDEEINVDTLKNIAKLIINQGNSNLAMHCHILVLTTVFVFS